MVATREVRPGLGFTAHGKAPPSVAGVERTPVHQKGQLVAQLYLIPNLFAKVVTGMKPNAAMLWAEEEIRKVHG